MDIDLFDFDLPKELIAQKPIENRQNSRMLVVDRKDGSINHEHFTDVIKYLNSGDVLVLNDTRVIPARIIGENVNSLGKMEFLLLRNIENNIWEVMCKPGRRALVGKKFSFGKGKLIAEIIEIKSDGNRIVNLDFEGNIYDLLKEIGEVPLPPYIKSSLDNGERYQTVYSEKLGSIAAPTAGLHFTLDVLEKIKLKGIKIVYLTLHVGLGTFLPIKVKNIYNHKMHSEYYEIDKYSCDLINSAKRNGNKVIAVGTTSMRVLETVGSIREDNVLFETSGYTDIFIKPGYKFKIVDALITNFHLPKSTLIILVSAFYKTEEILRVYNEAISKKYRFFSFGDSMFII